MNKLSKNISVNISRKIHKYECLCLSVVIPIIVMAISYHGVGIYPGGSNTVLTMDIGAQYMPFWASLRYIDITDNSLFFSMSGGLGNNFWGIAYYIFSPFAWITSICPLELLPDMIYFTTLLRIGLCGGSFSFFLWYTFPANRIQIFNILFSCAYALMSYNVGYTVNPMWLDAVLMLPWILVGIEKIIREKKPLAFILSVYLSMIFNYFITFMSAVFAVGYLFIRLKETRNWNLKTLTRFITYAIIGVGLAAPVIIPGVAALVDGKFSEGARPLTSLFRYNLIDVLNQLLPGRYDTLMDDGLPFIFCGTGTSVLVAVYFGKSNDKLEVKALWLGFIGFYLFTLCFIPLDRVMNGFTETSYYEGRYSYCCSCLLIILAYRGLDSIRNDLKNDHLKSMLCCFIALFVIGELYINSSLILMGIAKEATYETATGYKTNLEAKRELLCSLNDDGFYRISDHAPYTYNDGAWLGYNGIGYFSSNYNYKVMRFLGAIGEDQSFHVLRDGMRTPLEEALLGAKYRIEYSDSNSPEGKVTKNEFYSISQNKSVLSLGYMTKLTDDQIYKEFCKDAFENQNSLAKELSGIDDNVFIELPKQTLNNKYTGDYIKKTAFSVKTITDATVWLYVERADSLISYNDKKDTMLIVDGYDYGEFIDPGSESSFIRYIGKYEKGKQIDIEMFGNIEYGAVHVVYMDEGAYDRVIRELKKRQLILLEHGGGHFNGIIDAGEGGNLLLTVPAIDGWKIMVDGERVPAKSYRDTLLMIPLSEGEHVIDFRFVSPGFYLGIALGIISLIVFIVILSRDIFKDKKFGILGNDNK